MADTFSTHPTRRLLKLLTLEKNDIYLLVILTLGYGILGISTPIAVQSLVNIVTMGGLIQPLYIVAFILFILLVLSGTLYVFEAYVVELIQRRLFIRSALEIGKLAQGVQMQVYDTTNPVELMNRFFDITTIQKSSAVLLTVALTALLQGLVGSIILIFYSWYFIGIVVMVALIVSVVFFVLGKNGLPTAVAESKAKYKTAAWLETIARNNYLFKFFNAKQRTVTKTEYYAKTYLNTRFAHYKVLLMQGIGGVVLYAFVGTAMLLLGGLLVTQGQINLGQFVAAELIIFGVLAAFVRFISKLSDYYDLLAALDKIGVLQDLPQESTGTHIPPDGTYDEMNVENLTFSYTNRIIPIKDVSFNLKKGQSLAVLGASGQGKSTLVRLLTGLRTPSNGHISIDHIDLRQINLEHYRNRIGMVNKVEVIDGTVLENLLLGRKQISLDVVHDVLGSLELKNDIAKLEHGLDTPLTAFGAPLSTTQLQRLMLARSLVGNPELLCIDGLLDGLDKNELDAVIKTLKKESKNWMLIVTTRSPEIAANFDHQLSLEAGLGDKNV